VNRRRQLLEDVLGLLILLVWLVLFIFSMLHA